jgi:hypothetical protein
MDDFDQKKYWNPLIELENSLGELKSEVKYTVELDKYNNIPYIYERRKIKGTFQETLELNNFPVNS